MIGCHQSWRIYLLAAVVQVNSAFYNAITAYMRRRQAIIRAICDNPRVQWRYRPYMERRFWVNPGRTSAWWDNFINGVVFTSARACPVLVNGHVIRVFSRFNVDGDQF